MEKITYKSKIGAEQTYEKKTREAAKKAGDTLYWSGEVCDKSHKSPRYTRDNVCKQCYTEKKAAANALKLEELEATKEAELKKAA